MSAELAGLFRAAAHDEAVAAQREFPLGPDAVHRYVAAALRRRVARGALIAAVGAVVIGAGAVGIHHYWQGEPFAASPTAPITSSASEQPSASPTPSPSPTTSESPAPATAMPSETTPPAGEGTTPPAPPETPVGAVPGQVTTVSAGPGGGSGEIVVNWNTVPDATGYRVYRSTSADGPFVPAASVMVATGATTIEFDGSYEYIQIWPPSSNAYEYVEASIGSPGYFRVAAFNAAGTGPRSAVVCASAQGNPAVC